MIPTTENPYIDPKLKNVWEQGYSTACQQKDEEIARLRSVLEWYADPGNYLDENSDLATAWKMNENIANKAKEAIKK